MKQHVAFLRGINVGGRTMLAMKDLARLCEESGLESVRTYINSGNVLFRSSLPGEELRATLEQALHERWGKPIKIVVLSSAELKKIVEKNPFPDAKPAQVGVLLTVHSLAARLASEFKTPGREEWVIGKRWVYVHYPDGMGRSKLTWPSSLGDGTMRNLNTLSKLAAMAES